MKNNSNNYCTLYIVRHGQTEWNVKHIIQGQKDSNLTQEGITQAKNVAEAIKHIHFDAVFSSDLARTRKTAEIIALERKLAIKTSKLLRERTFGHFEGKSRDEYREETKDLLKKYQGLSEEEQWRFKFAEGYESDEELASRFITFLREIAITYPRKNVLVVTHGGNIRTFLAKIGYIKYGELQPGSVKNAGYVKVLSDGVDFFVKETVGVIAAAIDKPR